MVMSGVVDSNARCWVAGVARLVEMGSGSAGAELDEAGSWGNCFERDNGTKRSMGAKRMQ